MAYNKQTKLEYDRLKTYLEKEYFFSPIPKLMQKHLQTQHKKYSFSQIHTFLISHKKEITINITNKTHLCNKINWYIEHKMDDYLLKEQKNIAQNQVSADFHFLTYHVKPTPPSDDYDIFSL